MKNKEKENTIIDRIKEIINYILERENKPKIEKLYMKTSLRRDLDMDSLDLAELTVRIEEEYGVDIFEDGIIDRIEEIIPKILRYE